MNFSLLDRYFVIIDVTIANRGSVTRCKRAGSRIAMPVGDAGSGVPRAGSCASGRAGRRRHGCGTRARARARALAASRARHRAAASLRAPPGLRRALLQLPRRACRRISPLDRPLRARAVRSVCPTSSLFSSYSIDARFTMNALLAN